jgi:hypothetical protein
MINWRLIRGSLPFNLTRATSLLTIDRLPFATTPDIALGIAVKTFMDEIKPAQSQEERAAKMREFPGTFVPFATNFSEDLRICFSLFEALYKGVQSLSPKEMSTSDKSDWDRTYAYLQARKC